MISELSDYIRRRKDVLRNTSDTKDDRLSNADRIKELELLEDTIDQGIIVVVVKPD